MKQGCTGRPVILEHSKQIKGGKDATSCFIISFFKSRLLSTVFLLALGKLYQPPFISRKPPYLF